MIHARLQGFWYGVVFGVLGMVLVGAWYQWFFVRRPVPEYKESQTLVDRQTVPDAAPEPVSRRTTVRGEAVCLPHRDATGPQTLECALGVRTEDGGYYAVDFHLSSQGPQELVTGQGFEANGLFTPVEALSSDHWRVYPIRGIFSVTDGLRILP